ncbi:MAG: hypothetical protein ACUZ8A_06590 [Candidatus Bathyanammoxibius sp.]
MSPVAWVVLYFLLGIVSLATFDLVTKRLRTGLQGATDDTQSKLLAHGNYIAPKQATVLFVGVMLLFWPAVFVGIVKDKLTHWGGD